VTPADIAVTLARHEDGPACLGMRQPIRHGAQRKMLSPKMLTGDQIESVLAGSQLP
jgi:hypothetical protein